MIIRWESCKPLKPMGFSCIGTRFIPPGSYNSSPLGIFTGPQKESTSSLPSIIFQGVMLNFGRVYRLHPFTVYILHPTWRNHCSYPRYPLDLPCWNSCALGLYFVPIFWTNVIIYHRCSWLLSEQVAHEKHSIYIYIIFTIMNHIQYAIYIVGWRVQYDSILTIVHHIIGKTPLKMNPFMMRKKTSPHHLPFFLRNRFKGGQKLAFSHWRSVRISDFRVYLIKDMSHFRGHVKATCLNFLCFKKCTKIVVLSGSSDFLPLFMLESIFCRVLEICEKESSV